MSEKHNIISIITRLAEKNIAEHQLKNKTSLHHPKKEK